MPTTSTDTDGDTLPDFDEARRGTAADERDSDGDGIDDDVDPLPLDARIGVGTFAEVALVDMGWTLPFNTTDVSVIYDEPAAVAFVFVEPLRPWTCSRVVRRNSDGSFAATQLHDERHEHRRCAPTN